ncbi:MAG: tyrosine-type recombinase/integrase [Synergistaceae bacterium]
MLAQPLPKLNNNTSPKPTGILIPFPVDRIKATSPSIICESKKELTLNTPVIFTDNQVKHLITKEDNCTSSIDEHYAHPIKSEKDIARISNHLISTGKYRDNALFIVGINIGLRCSDLRLLKVNDFLNSDGSFKENFYILERKTANTRKLKQNRHIGINEAVQQSIRLLLANKPKALDDYLFTGDCNRCANVSAPLTRQSIDKIIKKIMKELEIDGRYATHTLRKTFGYHIMKKNGNDPRVLLLLQQIFGHSSQQITLRYIGFTEDEITKTYNELNLGMSNLRF